MSYYHTDNSLGDLTMHTLIDEDRGFQVFAYIEQDATFGEEFILKVMNKSSKDTKKLIDESR